MALRFSLFNHSIATVILWFFPSPTPYSKIILENLTNKKSNNHQVNEIELTTKHVQKWI